jgi:hypothetical protein
MMKVTMLVTAPPALLVTTGTRKLPAVGFVPLIKLLDKLVRNGYAGLTRGTLVRVNPGGKPDAENVVGTLLWLGKDAREYELLWFWRRKTETELTRTGAAGGFIRMTTLLELLPLALTAVTVEV